MQWNISLYRPIHWGVLQEIRFNGTATTIGKNLKNAQILQLFDLIQFGSISECLQCWNIFRSLTTAIWRGCWRWNSFTKGKIKLICDFSQFSWQHLYTNIKRNTTPSCVPIVQEANFQRNKFHKLGWPSILILLIIIAIIIIIIIISISIIIRHFSRRGGHRDWTLRVGSSHNIFRWTNCKFILAHKEILVCNFTNILIMNINE